ncbi:MAG: ABC transporter permease [Candidatus Neoclostridium sp.]
MATFLSFTGRNIKLFFKDLGLFLVSLITPGILLILFVTFLGDVYKNSFIDALGRAGLSASQSVINGLSGGQLVSSLLATSCVTVSFCSNMIMVQDKVYGMTNDFYITPVKRRTMALSYYVATFVNTMIVCLFALSISFIYLAAVGWFLTFTDVLLILLDVVLLASFGTALSSVVNFFLSSQGQMSAVGSIVSSTYGFLSGAYMPLSQLPQWLNTFVSFLPGTYGTALLRNHCMGSAFDRLVADASPENVETVKAVVQEIKNSVDCSINFAGGQAVPIAGMFAVLGGAIVVLIAAYILLNKFIKRKK